MPRAKRCSNHCIKRDASSNKRSLNERRVSYQNLNICESFGGLSYKVYVIKKKEKKNAQFLFNVIKSVASVYEGNKAMEKKKKKKRFEVFQTETN